MSDNHCQEEEISSDGKHTVLYIINLAIITHTQSAKQWW